MGLLFNFSRASKVNKLTEKSAEGNWSKFSFDADVNAQNANELDKHSMLSFFCSAPELLVPAPDSSSQTRQTVKDGGPRGRI